ncbi:MAG TPA: DUF4384 domain-containing protein [Blastocatellia bacterium]|nr:DUF4384 domain-containing protein [Blastocatellia bacterium]HMV82711.1 DUF4384 domain-containing protein [Blastocatellia bacterium]HMZ22806.1 DUF4384 domain-containing protein [Blastocatellia bacterium]HNG30400.1 DUF4384 domain-containing protein [Blastocatellia bacterium]
MKPRFIGILLFALTIILSGHNPAFAQGEQARDLFTSYATTNAAKGQPGAKISLELLRNGQRSLVPLNTSFYAGDKVKLHFEVNFAAYVAIYNAGTSGQIKKLYPVRSSYAAVAASNKYTVPAAPDQWFEFDNTPGEEKLVFTFSSAAPVKRPARAQPKATPKTATKKIETDVVIVEPGGRTLGGDDELSNEESDEALANGRDLHPVQLKDGYYAVGSPQQLKQRIGILIVLNHR